MPRLNELRRFENVTRITQSFYNHKQGEYQAVVAGGIINGGDLAADLSNIPYFRETTRHLTAKELYEVVQAETDVQLLRHLANVERQTGRRDSIIAMFENRVKAAEKESEELAKKQQTAKA